jgi:transcriptional regulator with XRE-family HTH domain
MTAKRNVDHSALELFAAELQISRNRAGLSQEQLGDLINFSGSLIGMVETARRPPSLDFAERCDEALKTGGLFARLHRYVSNETYPSWFREWVEIERDASWLRWMEPLLVPGLLQTEPYARAILGARADGGENLDQAVAGRLERQQILHRENPPRLWCVLDEAVLHRSVGGSAVMRDQLLHLAEMSLRPKVSIQIVPHQVGAHPCLQGGFIIADLEEAPSIVYLETAAAGQVVAAPAVVNQVALSYETVRSEALPALASRDLILKVAEKEWT